MNDAYSTISSPGELATYSQNRVNPLLSMFGGGLGGGQLGALLGQQFAIKTQREKMQNQMMANQLKDQMAPHQQAQSSGKYSWNPGDQMPEMSYVKEMHGFGMTPGAVQTGAGDVGAVQGGWMPGGGNRGAHVQGGGGPIMPQSTLPDYGGGQSAFAPQSQTDDRADWFGTGSHGSGKNQLQALMQQLSGK